MPPDYMNASSPSRDARETQDSGPSLRAPGGYKAFEARSRTIETISVAMTSRRSRGNSRARTDPFELYNGEWLLPYMSYN